MRLLEGLLAAWLLPACIASSCSADLIVSGTEFDGLYSLEQQTQVYMRANEDGSQSELLYYDCSWYLHTMDSRRQRILTPSYRTAGSGCAHHSDEAPQLPDADTLWHVNNCPECSPTPNGVEELPLIGGVSITCRDTAAAAVARSFDFETYARDDIAEVDRRSAFFDEFEQ